MGGHEIRPNHMKVKATRFDKMRNAEVRILPPQPRSRCRGARSLSRLS